MSSLISDIEAAYLDDAMPKRARDLLGEAAAALRAQQPQPMETAPRDGAWTYKVQHGPDGHADYAWLYRDDEMYAVMKTHHAAQVCAGMNTIPTTPQKDDAA